MAQTTAEIHVNRAARVLAPLAAFGAALIVRRVLETRYRKSTGDPIPRAKDLRVTFTRALLWSVATALVTTAVEVAVVRGIDTVGATVVAESPPEAIA